MASNKITLDGLDELRQYLRKLPEALAEEAASIIDRRAQNAAASIRTAYKQGETGNLRSRVTVKVVRSRAAVAAVVRSAAPHAALYEFGTGSLNVAHPGKNRQTAKGANRGSSPPHPTVIPIAQRERRAMNLELVDVVKRAGFDVTGSV